MAETVLKLILNYGLLPALAAYLVYTIAAEYKNDLRSMRTELENTKESITSAMFDQNETMLKLATAITKLQGTVTTQVNTILIRFIDLSTMRTKDDEGDE